MLQLLFLFFALYAYADDCFDMKQNHMIFFDTQEIELVHTALLDRSLYAQCVQALPICCVDIFVYNPITRCYFLVLRNVPPAKGIYFFPGGRMHKGESFFECAKRKCYEEAGLEIVPMQIIDVYNTIYPDSAWDCQTHTVNIAVFALCSDDIVALDHNHVEYRWQSIDVIPEHEYLKDIYYKAQELIAW